MPTGNQKITYIDLFAGAGGLSEGFAAAGYQPIAHVEMDVDACNTLRTREIFYYLNSVGANYKYLDYLKGKISRNDFYELIPRGILNSVICETMSNETMSDIFKKIDTAMNARAVDHVDLILGGPPCQAYSMVGRARKKVFMVSGTNADGGGTIYAYSQQIWIKGSYITGLLNGIDYL